MTTETPDSVKNQPLMSRRPRKSNLLDPEQLFALFVIAVVCLAYALADRWGFM